MCFCCCCCFNLGCFDTKDCCSFLSQKMFQIIYIIAYAFLLIFLISTMSIIEWDRFPKINLPLFLIIFFIIVGCTILGIILYCYTQCNNPSVQTKEKSYLVSRIGFIITIICLILSVLEEIFITIGFINSKKAYPCFGDGDVKVSTEVSVGFFFFKLGTENVAKKTDKRILSSNYDNYDYDYECYSIFLTAAVYGMTYFTLTMIEIITIISICFWSRAKNENFVTEYEHNQINQNYNNGQNPFINQNIQQQIVIVNQGDAQPQPQQQYSTYNQQEQNKIKGNDPVTNKNGNINYPSQQSVLIMNNKNNIGNDIVIHEGNNLNNNQDMSLNSKNDLKKN